MFSSKKRLTSSTVTVGNEYVGAFLMYLFAVLWFIVSFSLRRTLYHAKECTLEESHKEESTSGGSPAPNEKLNVTVCRIGYLESFFA